MNRAHPLGLNPFAPFAGRLLSKVAKPDQSTQPLSCRNTSRTPVARHNGQAVTLAPLNLHTGAQAFALRLRVIEGSIGRSVEVQVHPPLAPEVSRSSRPRDHFLAIKQNRS